MVAGRDDRERRAPPPNNLQAIQFNSLLMDPTYLVLAVDMVLSHYLMYSVGNRLGRTLTLCHLSRYPSVSIRLAQFAVHLAIRFDPAPHYTTQCAWISVTCPTSVVCTYEFISSSFSSLRLDV